MAATASGSPTSRAKHSTRKAIDHSLLMRIGRDQGDLLARQKAPAYEPTQHDGQDWPRLEVWRVRQRSWARRWPAALCRGRGCAPCPTRPWRPPPLPRSSAGAASPRRKDRPAPSARSPRRSDASTEGKVKPSQAASARARAGNAGARLADHDPDLAARRAGRELAERHNVGIVRLAQPAAAVAELSAKEAEVGIAELVRPRCSNTMKTSQGSRRRSHGRRRSVHVVNRALCSLALLHQGLVL